MTPDFIAAVLDTLLPGDDRLPSATRAGLPLAAYAEPHNAVLDAIAAQAGGPELFTRSDEASRGNAVRAVERAMSDAFRALLAAALSDYYESEPVLAALGWPTDPPQPAGHVPATMDDATAARLDHVAHRRRLWRSES
ncbi:MAG: hypothetical protein AB7S71_02735 [Dongiaceae bacterium]